MGQELYQQSEQAKIIFNSIDDSLGRSLTKIMFEGPEDELRETINAQPAIMAVSLACLSTMKAELGDSFLSSPSMMAGHSLGEYSALAASGVLSVADASLSSTCLLHCLPRPSTNIPMTLTMALTCYAQHATCRRGVPKH